MQILQGTQAGTDLPLSHAAKVKMGINHAPTPIAEILCMKDELLSAQTHDIPVGQHVMYREPHDGRWYPATITQQLPEKRSYIIKTDENVLYRTTQAHLKSYKPRKQMTQPEHNWVHSQITAGQRPGACYQSTKQTQPVTTIAFDQSAKVDHFTSSAV